MGWGAHEAPGLQKGRLPAEGLSRGGRKPGASHSSQKPTDLFSQTETELQHFLGGVM